MDLADLRGLNLRPHLLAAGYSDRELRRLRRAGALATIQPGAYVPSTDGRLVDDAARHELMVRATMHRVGTGAVASHASAAVLHGLPVWGVSLQRVHLTRSRRSGGRRNSCVHVHTAPMDPDETVTVGGVLTTSPARTVVDVARTAPFEQAVALADATLRAGLVNAAELLDAVERSAHRRGNTAARRVAGFADRRSESVGESRSRVAIARAGLPPPAPQWQVYSPAGALLGRVDFGWPEQLTVGEFDGRVKYGRLLRAGQEAGDAVFAEKQREDALRDEGLRVVRWTWADLGHFDQVAERLRRAFRAG